MRLLHLETGRHLYGGARQVLYLLQGLAADSGCQNHLACPAGSEIAEAASQTPGVTVHPMRAGGDLDVAMVARVHRLIRRIRPDLLHVHSRRGADLYGGLAARWAGIPAVISRRVDNPEPAWWAARKYALYARVITISEGIRQVLLGEGLAPDRVVTVPSAVDSARFQEPCDPGWFREALQLPAEGPTLGVIAQLIERKGHGVLLQALPDLRRRFPGLRVLFFGRGPLQDKLAAEVRERGLADTVQFAGFRDDLARILPCLDLVVHPARLEGLGVALLQAAASGRPIVASRAGGIPEIVRDGVNGRLVEPGDAAGLQAAIGELLADPARAEGLGQAGRRIVQREFAIQAMADGNRGVYRAVLGECG